METRLCELLRPRRVLDVFFRMAKLYLLRHVSAGNKMTMMNRLREKLSLPTVKEKSDQTASQISSDKLCTDHSLEAAGLVTRPLWPEISTWTISKEKHSLNPRR